MTDDRRLDDEQLDRVSGGSAGQCCYCVQGYSKSCGGQVKLYVSAYEDAVKLCIKLGLGEECIREVTGQF